MAESTVEAAMGVLARYRGEVDLAELRADYLDPSEAMAASHMPGKAGLPSILTVRRPADGGKFAGSERERVSLLSSLAPAGFAWADLEEDLDAPGLAERFSAAGTRIIRSVHDFSGTPDGLAQRLGRLARRPSEVPKLAVTPRGVADLNRLLELCRASRGQEKIILGMGAYGVATRILASKLGSLLCYAPAPGAAVAPGQIDARTLIDGYRFGSISETTAIYGVIGNPVLHSRSPFIHNRGIAALGLDAVYLPFQVDDLQAFWALADELGITGLSVTVPHKQAVIERLSARDALVDAVGACNTMARPPGRGAAGAGDGTAARGTGWTGTNTDVEGFLAPLLALTGGKLRPGLRATVIGAGGASRAVVYGLVRHGARVLVLNRSQDRAEELGRTFGVETAGLDDRGARLAAGSNLIVQTTPAGMEGQAADDAAPGLKFSGGEIVYELVYEPPTTPFLRRAQAAGCRIIDGWQMLVAQAMRQFELFTGHPYPAELAREVASGGAGKAGAGPSSTTASAGTR